MWYMLNLLGTIKTLKRDLQGSYYPRIIFSAYFVVFVDGNGPSRERWL